MDNLTLSQGGNLCLASGALANGTTAGTVKTTVAIPFTISGVLGSKAITDNISIAFSGPAVYGTPADGSFTGQVGGSTRLYGLYLDAAGAVTVEPGPIVNSAVLAAGGAPLTHPAPKFDKACFGVVRIAITANTTFIPGTTALNAAGVTTTYQNLMAVPGVPLTS